MKMEEELEVVDGNLGPDIPYAEFEKAVSELKKNRKAEGVDNIPGELLKALGNSGKQELYDFCKDIYANGEWPNYFTGAIIIPIEKQEKELRNA